MAEDQIPRSDRSEPVDAQTRLAEVARTVQRLAAEHADRPDVLSAVQDIVSAVGSAVAHGTDPDDLFANPPALVSRFEQPNWSRQTAVNIGSIIVPAAEAVQPATQTTRSLAPRNHTSAERASVARILLENLD